MTMKILDLQHTVMCKVDYIAWLKKQLEVTRAERDAARRAGDPAEPSHRGCLANGDGGATETGSSW